jgi:hypothetical protein
VRATTSEEPLGHIKGSAALEFLGWYRQEFGDEVLRDTLGRLRDEDGAYFDAGRHTLGLVPSMWYPARVIHSAIDEALRGLAPEEVESLARRGGKAMVDAKLHGLQRVLFSLIVSPEKYCKHVQRAWDLNYDSGFIEQRILSETCHESIVTGWRGHHAFLCDLNGEVKMELYRHMGCKDVRQGRRRCISRGDSVCGSTLTWR